MIRERRIAKKLTQEQMAGYPGVTAPAVNKWGERHVISGHHIASGIGQIVGYRFEYIVIFSGRFVRQRNCIILNELSELSEKEGVETLYVRAWTAQTVRFKIKAKADADFEIHGTQRV